jgi:ACS family allantoate permease-like MFS transporter
LAITIMDTYKSKREKSTTRQQGPKPLTTQTLRNYSILYTYWAPYVTLVSIYQANIAGHTKKVVLYAWFYIAWATGNIIGPQTFRADQAPAYTGGTVAMIVCYVIAIFAVLSYGALCALDNRKRREAIEARVAADFDWLDLTDRQNEGFRYTT